MFTAVWKGMYLMALEEKRIFAIIIFIFVF